MTDKPTPAQIQRACDLANAKPGMGGVAFAEYGRYGSLTALADTIAKLDAMQAERDKARADLAEIDRIAEEGVWGHPSAARNAQRVAAIAAPYRVETDPLDDLLWQTLIAWESGDDPGYGKRLGSPEGLPAWDTAKAAFRAELAKRGLEIGRSA